MHVKPEPDEAQVPRRRVGWEGSGARDLSRRTLVAGQVQVLTYKCENTVLITINQKVICKGRYQVELMYNFLSSVKVVAIKY